jgi:hypothetical protein
LLSYALFSKGLTLTRRQTPSVADLESGSTPFRLSRRSNSFFGRKFGQIEDQKNRHDANSKKINTATRTDKNCM